MRRLFFLTSLLLIAPGIALATDSIKSDCLTRGGSSHATSFVALGATEAAQAEASCVVFRRDGNFIEVGTIKSMTSVKTRDQRFQSYCDALANMSPSDPRYADFQASCSLANRSRWSAVCCAAVID